MDGAAVNRKVMDTVLGFFPDSSRRYTTVNPCSGDPLVWIMDIKHSVKKIRNGALSSSTADESKRHIRTSKGDIWDMWVQLYSWSSQKQFAIAHKITNEHIFLSGAAKMRNHLAEQVLDRDMLNSFKIYRHSLTNKDCLDGVIELLEHTSVLIDVFSDRKPIISGLDERLVMLATVAGYFEPFLDMPRKDTFTRKSMKDILSSIYGFIELCKVCVSKGIRVIPAYINSDDIENHFFQVRSLFGGSSDHPTYLGYMGLQNSIVLSQPCGLPSKRNANTYIEPLGNI